LQAQLNAKKLSAGRWIHIIIPTILVYIVAYMDRANISFAIAGGMDSALGLSATFAGLASGIFFIGYLVLQVPGGMIAERGNAKKYIAWTIIAWGVVATLTGFVQNEWELLGLRFLLGVVEGGLMPAILAILSHWFTNEERGRANGYFYINIAIANIITGPISGWLIQFYNWREVFIVEGIVSLALIVVWLPLITNKPEDAKWLTQEEKDQLKARIAEEQEIMRENHGRRMAFKDIFVDSNLWKLVLIYFCYQAGAYGFSLWLPTIVKSLTNQGMGNVGLLTAIPYVALAIGFVVFSVLSDRNHNRKLYTAIPLIGFALCLILSLEFKADVIVSFMFLVFCGFFFQSAAPIFWAIVPSLYPDDVAGGARGIIGGIGNLGGFLGPYIVGLLISQTHGDTSIGLYGMSFILFVGFLITLTLPKITSQMTIQREERISLQQVEIATEQ
jgi:sugar phosphate permease